MKYLAKYLAQLENFTELSIEELYKYAQTLEFLVTGAVEKPEWFDEQKVTAISAIKRVESLQKITECSSEDGITIGLIDSILTSAKILITRNLNQPEVVEALKDLYSDKSLRYLLDQAEDFYNYK